MHSVKHSSRQRDERDTSKLTHSTGNGDSTMSNMSYCMFENTSNDMRQCIRTINEDGVRVSELSITQEKIAYRNFLEQCVEIAEMLKEYESIDDFIELTDAHDTDPNADDEKEGE